MKKFNIIVCCCENNGIGFDNHLPWTLKKEFQYFSTKTKTCTEKKINAVIMGRKTWDSIPENFRPLSGRLNVIISKTMQVAPEGTYLFNELNLAIEKVSLMDEVDKIFIIGGESIYSQALLMPECDKIYLTRILKYYKCDTFFPQIEGIFQKIDEDEVPNEMQEENGIYYFYNVYKRRN